MSGMGKGRLYFAYGSNLHLDQMESRCPTAVPLIPLTLPGYRLVFRGVADVERDEDERVVGALYRIRERDERALDRYEGFPRLYTKATFRIRLKDQKAHEALGYQWKGGARVVRAMLYFMVDQRRSTVRPPSAGYLQTIAEGYGHWGLDPSALECALQRAERKRA